MQVRTPLYIYTHVCLHSELVWARVLLTDGQAQRASPVDGEMLVGASQSVDGATHTQLECRQQRRAVVPVVTSSSGTGPGSSRAGHGSHDMVRRLRIVQRARVSAAGAASSPGFGIVLAAVAGGIA